MAALVTLEEVKTGLRIDSSDDDNLIQALIGAASNGIINFLKADETTVLFDWDTVQGNSPQDADVSDEVKQATILLVDYYYRGDYENAEPGYLPPHVTALIWGKRTPTIA